MNTNSGVKRVLWAVAATVAIGLVSAWAWAGSDMVTEHPELSEQEKFIECASCHQETTPELHKEWFDSVHGLSMVKCYQCHGTYETFKVSPPVDNCSICHVAMSAESHSKNKRCWECHTPHTFKAE